MNKYYANFLLLLVCSTPVFSFGDAAIIPVSYKRISSDYGWRIHPISRVAKFHTGIDYAAPEGSPVKAAMSGNIVFKGWKGGYGKTVMIRHKNGIETLYGHLSSFASLDVGQPVTKGELIGKVGSTGHSTGPHLHFEIRKNGKAVNPALVKLQAPKKTVWLAKNELSPLHSDIPDYGGSIPLKRNEEPPFVVTAGKKSNAEFNHVVQVRKIVHSQRTERRQKSFVTTLSDNGSYVDVF